MQQEPSVDAAKRIFGEPGTEVTSSPEATEHETLVHEFIEDAGETAVEETVEMTQDSETLLNGMDYNDIDKNIDTLLVSSVDPEVIFDRLGPNLYYHHNVTKLLDAGMPPMRVFDTLMGSNKMVGSATVAENLDAFIRGVGSGVIAAHLESSWLSMCFDKLVAAGLSLGSVDTLLKQGKLKVEAVERSRESRATIPSLDSQYGVDKVLDLGTGKWLEASRPEQEAAA